MTTEIESRYIVPDRVLFTSLLRLRRLGQYVLRPHGVLKVIDYYLDTKGRALHRQGWACRLRSQDGAWLLTLKGPKEKSQGAVVARPELEISLPERIEDVAHWPRGRIRDRVVELTGGLALRHLLTIKQTRHRFLVLRDSRQVGELSLDDVRVSARGIRHRTYMLECELLGGGRLADLHRLDASLGDEYHLIPEPRSKLQRALTFIEEGGSPDAAIAHQAPPLSVEGLCDRYGVDLWRARHVADLAHALYDGLLPVHQLPEARRSLLRTAAMLHNVGESGGGAYRHIIGRDILLRHPVEGVGEEDQRILAAAAYLHRKRVLPGRIAQALPDTLSRQPRQEALTIAALVRLASALDSSRSQSTRIHQVERTDDSMRITLAGPHAVRDARRAQKRSDLWAILFDTQLDWRPLSPQDEAGGDRATGKKRIGLLPSDSMREAAAKALRFHFQRMLQHVEGTRVGCDPEELHDMRVATRRMRSALRLFGPYVTGRLVTQCNDSLRRLARALGDVRDMDVALLRVETYLADFSSPEAESMDHLVDAWRKRRRQARRLMLRYLDSRSYQGFLTDFRGLLEDLSSSGAATPETESVSRVAPRFLYVLWQIVRAYRVVLEGAPVELLHALRIDCKRLRYALEFFREVLPKTVVAVIPEIVATQDHLGEMHDAAVAIDMVDDFLSQRQDAAQIEGIMAYREACRADMDRSVQTFPSAWKRLSQLRLSRKLKALVSP